MEEKVKQKRLHKMHMENRNKLEMTGIVDVISFDLNKVILESDCGMITINSYAKKGESMLGRLFR